MKTCLIIFLAGLTFARAEDTDKLAPYRDFVACWQKFNEQAQNAVWETTFEGKPEKKFWQEPTHVFEPPAPTDPKTNAPPTVRTESVSNTAVVVFDAPLAEQAFLPVGPKVKGDFAIELVCRTVGGRTNDLSILLDGMAKGPGFQFGGYGNTRNLLRADDEDGNWKQVTDLPGTKRIEFEKWHKVRLEIYKGEMFGYVDGDRLGSVRLGAAYKAETEWQPVFYIYSSIGQVKSCTIQRPATGAAPKLAELWKKHVGTGTPADAETKIAELIKLLDHEDFKTRSTAQEVLQQFGAAAKRQLQAAVKQGTPEQQSRARQLLGLPEE